MARWWLGKRARAILYTSISRRLAARALQCSVKVAGVACVHGHDCISREETPRPPPCSSPSPQGRGREIKITTLSQGRGYPREEGR